MKIKFQDGYKRFFTLEDIEHAKTFEREHKASDDGGKIDFAWEAEQMIKEAINWSDDIIKIYEIKAEWAKNRRAWNIYDGTGDMDVWISVVAKIRTGTTYAFIECKGCLSDIWQIGAKDVNVKQHFSVYMYKEEG